MEALGLNVSDFLINELGFGRLSLKRTILKASISNSKQKKAVRFRSKCEINGKQVTLKVLRSIARPLITIVDATAASSALSQGKARVAIIDTGVSNEILSKVKVSRRNYRDARKKREDIEREIQNRIMPTSFTSMDSAENIELLQHWIEELNTFEKEILTFQDSIVSSKSAALLLKTDDDFIDDYVLDNSTGFSNKRSLSFTENLKNFAGSSWEKDKTSGQDASAINASFYSKLLDLRDGVKSLDSQLSSARASCDALSLLSSSQSVAFALEESRRHLFDATIGTENNSALNVASEHSHELLNKLEDALSSCANYMTDHPSGLLSSIEKMRSSVSISIEDIDMLIVEWGSLARKHGLSEFLLPALQHSLEQELDGNVEAQSLLPMAKENERRALVIFEELCRELSRERLKVCDYLTTSVTTRLKDLGMEGSTFTAQLSDEVYQCTDSSAYLDSAILGIDTVDFLLRHSHLNSYSSDNSNRKGDVNLEVIGSSGEKARILLAIETNLPGSVGASCNSMFNSNDMVEALENVGNCSPVSVVYDEIDAHVGGNAAVSVAKLLVDQTQSRDNDLDSRRSQVISITHSPSLAAIADRHVVVRKLLPNESRIGKDLVLVNSVRGLSRLQEISRMASGDLAVKESIQFAEALLRDGMKYKQAKARN
jgi:DNA repair ATPase RecN